MEKRILLTFPPNSMIAKGMAFDCHEAFLRLGWESKLIDFTSLTENPTEFLVTDFDLEIKKFNPAVFFTFNNFGISNYFLGKENLQIVDWFLDPPKSLKLTASHENYFSFVFEKVYLKDLKEKGFQKASHLPLATRPERFSNVKVTKEEKKKFPFDVAFIGNCTEKRAKLISQIPKHISVGIWGHETWKPYAKENITYMGMSDYETETPCIYQSTKINLNINDAPVLTTVNNRVYDVPAAGGFVLTNDMEDLPVLFPGGEIPCFKNLEELNQKIDYFLKNKEEREKAIQAAREVILKNHTYLNRMKQVIEIIEEDFKKEKPLTPKQQIFRDSLFREGENLIQSGEIEKGLDILEELCEKQDNKTWIYSLLGSHFLDLKQNEAARFFIKKGLTVNPENGFLLNLKGIYLKEIGKYEKAKNCFLAALKTQSGEITIFNNLASTYLLLEETQKAKEIISQIIKAAPNYTPSLFNLFRIYLIEKNFKEAIALSKKILELDPSYATSIKLELNEKLSSFVS